MLDEILDDPEDVALALVYADWLEEQGDPLADLIRAHCAGREPDAALIAQLEQRLTPLSEWLVRDPCFAGWMLHRIELTAGKYAQKKTQAVLAPILSRYGVKTTALHNHSGKVHECSTLAWTTELVWADCHITDFEIEELAACPYITRLTKLVLEKPRCSNDGLRALATSPNVGRLRHLGLQSPPSGLYDTDGVLALIDALSITSLDLGGSRSKVDFAAFDGRPLAKLEKLAISTRGRWHGLASSRHLTNLTHLRVAAFGYKNDRTIHALLDNPALANLQHLELQIFDIGDDVIERLQERFGDRWSHDRMFID